MGTLLLIFRLQPRLCAASPFKVETVKELHILHTKPCFWIDEYFVDKNLSRAGNFKSSNCDKIFFCDSLNVFEMASFCVINELYSRLISSNISFGIVCVSFWR